MNRFCILKNVPEGLYFLGYYKKNPGCYDWFDLKTIKYDFAGCKYFDSTSKLAGWTSSNLVGFPSEYEVILTEEELEVLLIMSS